MGWLINLQHKDKFKDYDVSATFVSWYRIGLEHCMCFLVLAAQLSKL